SRSGRVDVMLIPMFKKMFVAGKDRAKMIFTEKGRVDLTELFGRFFDTGAAMRPGGEDRMMTEREKISVTVKVEAFELPDGPIVLDFVPGDVGIKSDKETVAVAKGEGRVILKTAGGPFGRNELSNRSEVVGESFQAIGRRKFAGAGHIVIAGSEKVRDTALGGEALDNAEETGVPLFRIAAIDYGIARLQNEPDREFCFFASGYRAEH